MRYTHHQPGDTTYTITDHTSYVSPSYEAHTWIDDQTATTMQTTTALRLSLGSVHIGTQQTHTIKTRTGDPIGQPVSTYSEYHADYLGTTTLITDDTGVVQQSNYTLPYGEIPTQSQSQSQTAPSVPSPTLYFALHQRDASTEISSGGDLVYMQARYYNDGIKRFRHK